MIPHVARRAGFFFSRWLQGHRRRLCQIQAPSGDCAGALQARSTSISCRWFLDCHQLATSTGFGGRRQRGTGPVRSSPGCCWSTVGQGRGVNRLDDSRAVGGPALDETLVDAVLQIVPRDPRHETPARGGCLLDHACRTPDSLTSGRGVASYIIPTHGQAVELTTTVWTRLDRSPRVHSISRFSRAIP